MKTTTVYKWSEMWHAIAIARIASDFLELQSLQVEAYNLTKVTIRSFISFASAITISHCLIFYFFSFVFYFSFAASIRLHFRFGCLAYLRATLYCMRAQLHKNYKNAVANNSTELGPSPPKVVAISQ